MAAFISTAAMAVSVVVLGPNPVREPLNWQTPDRSNFAQAVEQWADHAGLPKPEIDSRVATIAVGRVSVAGNDVCEAVRKLVSALKYAEQRPELLGCDAASDGHIVIGVTSR